MSSACSRSPQILNGHHDDHDDDVEGDDGLGDEDEEGKNDENGYITVEPILCNTVMLDFGGKN